MPETQGLVGVGALGGGKVWGDVWGEGEGVGGCEGVGCWVGWVGCGGEWSAKGLGGMTESKQSIHST